MGPDPGAAAGALYGLDLLGTAVFAASGALAARGRRMDLFGVVVLATVTAVGGGTLRDLVLDAAPVFWVRDPTYVLVAAGAGIATAFAAGRLHLAGGAAAVADALGLAVFSVIGTQVALDHDTSWIIAAVMGVMTGVAGGIVRDVLVNRVPLVLREEVYATAALAGALVYVALARTGGATVSAMLIGGAVTFGIRMAALRWHLSLPVPTAVGSARKKG